MCSMRLMRLMRLMRTPGWTVMRLLVLGLGLLAGAPASACWQCDGLGCVTLEGGARACFYGVHGCTTLGACGEGGPERFGGDGDMALQLTWIESEDPAAGPRVLRGAGRRVFGTAALRAFRAAAGRPAEDAAVVAAVAGFGEAFEVSLVTLGSDAGDGVALAWTAEGRGGHVLVYARSAGAAGERLADERLAENDVLVVPVRHDGRACTLVIQPRVLPRLSVRLETTDLLRAARDAVRPGRTGLAIGVAARE
jgi:hypothetical protein